MRASFFKTLIIVLIIIRISNSKMWRGGAEARRGEVPDLGIFPDLAFFQEGGLSPPPPYLPPPSSPRLPLACLAGLPDEEGVNRMRDAA